MNSSRSAFTLMEMLVVVALLATLMGLGAAGMRVADNSAKQTRSRATIAKLNRFVMEKYASYQYRRVPGRGDTRLRRLYSLMRYEMPDHWDDVDSNSPQRYQIAKTQYDHTSDVQSAELLYLIVSSLPEAESAFTSMEIADTDGNGLNEFVDGWGTPIYFIRWPAGHCDGNYGAISKIQNGTDADPFDLNSTISSYAVFPLIFSCGADKAKGIIMSLNQSHPTGNQKTGSPGEGGDSGDSAKETSMYYDNITNHNL